MLKHKWRINFMKMGLAIVMVAVGLFSVGIAAHAAGPNNNDYTASTGVNRASGISSTGTALSTSSPVNIVFPSSGSFALNYVDKTGYVSPDGSTNPSGVSNLTDSSGNIILNNNQLMNNGNTAYSGGYLQARGNLSLRVTLDSSVSGTNFVNNMSSGNYGVMVKVELPKDMDASAMAKAIVWDKAYMMLQMSVPLAGSPQFPMQFDHHVYLDPDHSNVFFLKVKGIPLIHSETNSIFSRTSTIKLARFAQDSTDYRNNVSNDGSVITPSELGTSVDGKTGGGSVLDVWEFLPPGLIGAVGLNGSVGYSLAMINRASALSWLVGSGFDGTANINFYIDMSKYDGNVSDKSPGKQLTKGKLAPSPRADGKLEMKMSMYGSSQLVDPYNVNQGVSNYTYAAGTSPIDNARVKSDQVNSGTNVPVTSNVKSWNAYASPFDSRSTNSLNTETSAWETAAGSSKRLPNVSATDTLTDRLAKLDIKLDGLMVNTGKGSDAAGTDYSGSTTGTVGAVGANRFARVVNYFDTSALDTNNEGALLQDKKVVAASRLNLSPLYRIAATAGAVNLSSDRANTLPSLSTANTQYVYYSGNTTLPTNGSVPILPAPLFYTQGTIPSPSVSMTDNSLTVYTSQLTGGKTVSASGKWADDYANTDSISAKDSVTGNTAIVASGLSASSSKDFSVKLSSGAVSGALNLGTGSTLVGTHTITNTITQPSVKLANGQTINTGKTGTGTFTVNVIDDSNLADVSITKSAVSDGSLMTTLPVKNATSTAAGETVTLRSDITNRGTQLDSPVIQSNLSSALTYKGSLSVMVNGSPVTATASVANNVLSLKLPSALKAQDHVIVQYQVQVTSPLATTGVTLTDQLMNGTTLSGRSNSVTLLPIVSGALSLVQVPGPLNFGSHEVPTAGDVFDNEATTNTLAVSDGQTTSNGWKVSASMTPFSGNGTQFSSAALSYESSASLVWATNTNTLLAQQSGSNTGYWHKDYPNIKLQFGAGTYEISDYKSTITYTLATNVNPN